MQGPFTTPQALAHAFLRGGRVTPERLHKLLWHARKGTRAQFEATLAAIPDPAVRAQVKDAAGAAVMFRG